jgi:hypothetical protein
VRHNTRVRLLGSHPGRKADRGRTIIGRPTAPAGDFCWEKTALSLQFGEITLHFPKLQGETGSRQTVSTAT